MFSASANTSSDPEKYAQWVPKINAYRAKLASGIKDDYKLPAELMPLQHDLDKGIDVTGIPKKVLSPEEFAITETSGTVLAQKLAQGQYSAVQVFQAFARRATIAHQLTDCAMELFTDDGLQRAQELDAYYAKTGKTVGPLHGLPVSLKEHFNYKGRVTHAGYVGLLDNVPDHYSRTVEDLLHQGAVFYIRTTEPQSLMHLCSNNNITGTCRNPCNTSLTPGGSSSGEGALTAMKGSVFGLGSDIGGSVRCPAAFCGVWGLRPTSKRLSFLGSMLAWTEHVQEAVYPVMGPLARSADDIDLFMKAALDSEPWRVDPLIAPLPWRDTAVPEARKLKIAVCYDDGVVRPTPPILRALKEATTKLHAAGVTVVEWKTSDVEEIVQACYKAYNYDGNASQKAALALSGEPLLTLTDVNQAFGCGDAGLSGRDVQQVCYVRDKGRLDYMEKLNAENIDFVLSPTYVSVAAKPETVQYWGYTNLWNLLDFPNVVFPTGLSVEPTDVVDSSFEPRSEVEKYEYALYTSPEDFAGAPICLQLTGRRYADESVVKAAKVLAEIIQ